MDGIYMFFVTLALIASLCGNCSYHVRRNAIESYCSEKCAPLQSRFTVEDLCQCAEAQTWEGPGE